MSTMKIHVDPSLCTECRMCQLACSDAKDQGFNPRLALLQIKTENEGLLARPVVCVQCDNPFCMRVCPVGAIEKRDDGVVVIDDDTCIGCGGCAEACFQGVIELADVARKCDLCGACVEACPTGALRMVSIMEEE